MLQRLLESNQNWRRGCVCSPCNSLANASKCSFKIRINFTSFLFFFQTTTTPPRKTQTLPQQTTTKDIHIFVRQLFSTMYQPEQQSHPLDRKENEKTTTSAVGEKISHLGEKLSGTILGGDNSSKVATQTTGSHGLPSKEEATVRCLADFAIYPIGTTASFHKQIDEVEKVLKRCGMSVSLFHCSHCFWLSRYLLLPVCSFGVVGCYLGTPSVLTNTNSCFLAFVRSASFTFFVSLFRRRLQGPCPEHYNGGRDGSHHVRDQVLPRGSPRHGLPPHCVKVCLHSPHSFIISLCSNQ